LPAIEAALEPFEPRPHWGKLFDFEGVDVSDRFERFPGFKRLAHLYDPTGKFSNRFLRRIGVHA
ncbi:MAG: FAD-binding protein, partial [Acidimicrobiia bacterium]|nr:FAD-binding protein [Acidimicrobiia bacterium]